MTARLVAAVAELAEALVEAARLGAAPSPTAPDRLLSVDEAAAALGIGRTATYGEMAAGRLRSVKVGRRRLVAAEAVAEYIATARIRVVG